MDEYIRFNGSRVKNIQGQHFGHLIPQKVVGIKDRYGNAYATYAEAQEKYLQSD